jgi:hypothetical protein
VSWTHLADCPSGVFVVETTSRVVIVEVEFTESHQTGVGTFLESPSPLEEEVERSHDKRVRE